MKNFFFTTILILTLTAVGFAQNLLKDEKISVIKPTLETANEQSELNDVKRFVLPKKTEIGLKLKPLNGWQSLTVKKINRKVLPQTTTYTRPDAKERFRKFAKSFINPFTYIGAGIGAGISTASNNPEEWGKKSKGFARRFGSNVARGAIERTITYSLDEAFRLDSNYYRSNSKKFSSRLGNALVSTVTARTPSGKRTLGVPFLVGNYTAHVIAVEAWFPKRFNYQDGLRNGTISIATRAGLNIFREFFFKK